MNTIAPMSKKTKKDSAPPPPPERAVLYVEMDADLKRRLTRLANLPHRNRKISAEAIMAIRRYVEEEEAKEGLEPIS